MDPKIEIYSASGELIAVEDPDNYVDYETYGFAYVFGVEPSLSINLDAGTYTARGEN